MSNGEEKHQYTTEQLQDGWAVWSKKVLSDIDYLITNQKELYQKIENLKIDIAVVKTKVAFIAGGISLASSAVMVATMKYLIGG